MARLRNLSPLSFHPTLVHHCTRLSRPATPCGALPLVRLCIICGAVWHLCSRPTLMALVGFPVPFLSFQRFMSLLLFFQASCLCFVEGEGFEPPMSCITLYYQLKDASVDNCRRCFQPLSQPSFLPCLAVLPQGLAAFIAAASCRHTIHRLCSELS